MGRAPGCVGGARTGGCGQPNAPLASVGYPPDRGSWHRAGSVRRARGQVGSDPVLDPDRVPEEPGPVEPLDADPAAPDSAEPDPGDPDAAEPDPAAPDPDPAAPDPAAPDPELLLRRVLGDDAVERELAPAVRVRVDGLVPDVPEVEVDLEVRVEDRRVPEAAEAALDVAGFDAVALLARLSSCSRARTRCWRRATSSRVAMPRRPS